MQVGRKKCYIDRVFQLQVLNADRKQWGKMSFEVMERWGSLEARRLGLQSVNWAAHWVGVMILPLSGPPLVIRGNPQACERVGDSSFRRHVLWHSGKTHDIYTLKPFGVLKLYVNICCCLVSGAVDGNPVNWILSTWVVCSQVQDLPESSLWAWEQF